MEQSWEQLFEGREPSEASQYFGQHPEQIEAAIIGHLIRARPISLPRILQACLWILCGGQGSPEELKREIERKRAGKSNVCGKIWNNGDLAYKCRDCGYDEPCAVCVECFQEGNHKDHDFLLIQVSGGCCDCGDPLAWRPEGNCVRHVGNSDSFDPSELLNPVQRGATLATLQAVVWSFSKVVLDVCRSVSSLVHVPAPLPIRHLIPSTSGAGQGRNPEVFRLIERCARLLHWLERTVEFFGDPMKRLLCLAVDNLPIMTTDDATCTPAPEASAADKLIIQLLLMDHLVPSPLQDQVRKWYFTLIGDTKYKKVFSICYIKAYPFLMDVYVEEKSRPQKSTYESILTMSTQFFHPHLIPHLVENGNLLDMLLDKTYQILQPAFMELTDGDGSGTLRSKLIASNSPILRKRLFWIIFYDLRAIIAVPAVAQCLTMGSLISLEKLLRLWSLLHEMDPTPRRRIRTHVPIESNSWVHAFTIEIELLEIVTEQVADAIEVLSPTDLARPDAIAHARAAVRRCLDAFIDNSSLCYGLSLQGHLCLKFHNRSVCLRVEEHQDDDAETGWPAGRGQLVTLPWGGRRVRIADFDVHRHSGVSFHIPLTRLLTRLLVAFSLVWRIPIPTLFPEATEQELACYALSLLEGPLRIQVLTAQAHCGAWIRNGWELVQASAVYSTQVEAQGMLNVDIATLQVAATLLHHANHHDDTYADALMPILLHRFTLSHYFDWVAHTTEDGPGSLEPKHKQALAENLLRLVISILNDRAVVGMPLPPATNENWKEEHHHLHMKSFIFRTVVHALATGPKTHSQVVKSVGESMLKHRHDYFPHVRIQNLVDQAINELSDFTPPSGPSHPTGIYALKPSCLFLFDPYYPHYTRQELQSALEFYHTSVMKLRPSSQGVPGVPLPNLNEVPEVVQDGLVSLSRSPTLMAVLFSILHHIRGTRLSQLQASNSSVLGDIALLHPVLTLLKLMIQFQARFPAPGEELAMEEVLEVRSIFDLTFKSTNPAVNICQQFSLGQQRESVLWLLVQLRAMEGEEMAEYRHALDEVLGLLDAHGGQLVKAALGQLTTVFDEQRHSNEALQRKEALRKKKMEENKARQQAILAQFAAKQKAFSNQAKKQEEEEEESSQDTSAERRDEDKTSSFNKDDSAAVDLLPSEGTQADPIEADSVCVFCKEGAQPGKGLGYVVFVQHSHVLPVAKRMSLGKLYLPQSRLIASFFRPELALSASSLLTSKKDKGKAEAEAETEVVTEPEQVTRDGSVLSSQENDAEGGDTQPTVPRADEDEEACKRREAAEQAAREKRWRAELEREVEGSGGAVVNSCGHLMHVECRHQYSLSIARDINLNRPTIDPMLTPAAVAQGVFRCPLCRSLANALIPALPPALNLLSCDSAETSLLQDNNTNWEEWVARSASPAEAEEVADTMALTAEEEVRSALQYFATRVYSSQVNVRMETVDLQPKEVEPHLWSLVTCMVSSLELATRPDPASNSSSEAGWAALSRIATERRGVTLRTVCRAVLAFSQSCGASNRHRLRLADRFLRRSLASSLMDDPTEEAVGPATAFLKQDMFAHFVRRYFIDLLLSPASGRDNVALGRESLRWARLLYVSTFVQAVVTLTASSYGLGDPAEKEEQEEDKEDKEEERDRQALAFIMNHFQALSAGRLSPHGSWTTHQWKRFAEELRHLLLPFARRVTFLLLLCGRLHARPLLSSFSNSLPQPRQELDALLASLDIPGAFAPALDDAMSPLVQQWLLQLLPADSSPQSRLPLVLAPDLPFHFDRRALPFLFQDLVFFRAPSEGICPTCLQAPRHPAVCLLCNRIVCVGSSCCAPQDQPGECNTHALKCAGGEGVYLLIRQTVTLLLQTHEKQGCLKGSLYLDEHKEEDVGLRRGRQLYLDPTRYEELRTLWLDHQMLSLITGRAPSVDTNWRQL